MTSRIESSTHPLAMETQITNETRSSEDHDEQSSGSTTKNSGPDTTKLSDENNKQTKGPEEQQQFSILEQSSPQVKPRSYASKLSYIPNEDFPANQTSMFESSPGASIPNTFKYKSHPNARAKALGTTTRITEEGSTELHEDVQNHEPTNGAAHITTTNDNTKEWMPKELATKELGSNWILQNSDELKLPVNDFPSVRIKNGSDNNSPFQDFDLNTANTMIHNSNVQSETPAFKKANKEYEEQRGKDLFPNIFVQQNPEEVNAKDHSASSTFSTPFNSINKLPPQALETVRESKDTNNNPSSPLKLYGSKYDTFTKSKLNNILDNMAKSTKNTPIQSQSQQKQKPKVQEQKSKEHNEKENVPPAIKFNPSITNTPPVKNIKDFTKTGAYSETTFIKHADNVFTNIKKRGFKGNTDGVRVVSQATATSTPKKSINIEDPIDFGPDNDYASYTSGYSSDDTNDIDHQPPQHSYHNFEVSSDDPQNYTSYTRDSNSQMRPESQEHEIIQHHSSSSGTYTFDEMSDKSDEPGTTEINPINSNYMSQDTKAHLYQAKIVQNRIPLFEQENSQLMENVKKPVDMTNISYKSSVPDSSYRPNSFKWKTRSQLELNNRPEIGRFGPDVTLPSRYESVGMVFDQENQRWLSSNEKSVQDAFRSIDDLSIGPAEQSTMNGTNQQEPPQQHQSILKKASTKRNGGTLEVSFHEPDISVESTNHNPMLGDVTRLSQIPELSFSESKKKLVPVITEVLELGNSLEPVSWKEIREIKLNNNDLNNVKDLNALLPSLISADLSHNDIKYLTGIPKQILSLNLSDNRIENITPFSDYRDLRDLNLENNQLTTVSNLDKNVHLTRLSLKNNQILNIKGISNLMNLTYLNVSRNELQGKLNFNMYDFQNLAVLDLSENNIQEILGLQNLPKLKVLDLDNNGLMKFEGRSKSLVKLSIRFNNVRKLNVSKVPQLRALKFDGNQIEKIEGLEILGKLEEISCKSQFRSSIVDQILQTTKDVRKLDLSGNRHFTNTTSIFPFVNSLTLSATNLSEIPTNFAVQFPNVQSLNLSFNKLKDINGLKELKNLRKVYMVDNKLQSFKQLTKGLTGSKSTLRVLDVRLNPCTENIYPYLFSPEELETSALNIENGDDIQSFLIRYEELDKSELWTTRDEIFLEHLKSRKDVELLGSRDIFECAMVTYFFNLSRLDGNWIDDDRRQYFDNLSKHS